MNFIRKSLKSVGWILLLIIFSLGAFVLNIIQGFGVFLSGFVDDVAPFYVAVRHVLSRIWKE